MTRHTQIDADGTVINFVRHSVEMSQKKFLGRGCDKMGDKKRSVSRREEMDEDAASDSRCSKANPTHLETFLGGAHNFCTANSKTSAKSSAYYGVQRE